MAKESKGKNSFGIIEKLLPFREIQQLKHKIDQFTIINGVGKTIASTLDSNQVFAYIVDAAIKLSGAEEATLFLLEQPSGALYLRAQKAISDSSSHIVNIQAADTYAREAITTGKPVIRVGTIKIDMGQIVGSVIYVPVIYKKLVYTCFCNF